jgi:hypothetical protein
MAKGGKRPGAGRPRGVASIQAQLAREKIVKRLDKELPGIITMLMKKVKEGDLKALEILLERGYGKALQPISDPNGDELNVNITLDESQLTRIAGRIRNGGAPIKA